MADLREDVTQVLEQLKGGDRRAADKLLPMVYDEFRALARHYLAQERANHTLQPTALVHEAYMKLVDQTRVDWQGKSHFFAVAAQAMRRILVDHARSRQRDKRGGGRARVVLDEAVALSPQKDEDVIALDEALEKLAQLDPRQAKVVELRFFGGLTIKETAELMAMSEMTVRREWMTAKRWLQEEMSGRPGS
jgi:RNA polymerase sigma factor (TIGR02999 family)